MRGECTGSQGAQSSSVMMRVMQKPSTGQAGDGIMARRMCGLPDAEGKTKKTSRYRLAYENKWRQSVYCGSYWNPENQTGWSQDCEHRVWASCLVQMWQNLYGLNLNSVSVGLPLLIPVCFQEVLRLYRLPSHYGRHITIHQFPLWSRMASMHKFLHTSVSCHVMSSATSGPYQMWALCFEPPEP